MTGLPKSIIKKYGISKKAWAVFRGRKSPKVSRTMTKKKGVYRRRAYAAKKRYVSRAKGLGGLGKGLTLKSLAFGTAGLIVANQYQPFGGAYKPALDKVAIGLVGPMVGMDNKDMFTVGIKEGLAILVGGFLGGGGIATGGGDSI